MRRKFGKSASVAFSPSSFPTAHIAPGTVTVQSPDFACVEGIKLVLWTMNRLKDVPTASPARSDQAAGGGAYRAKAASIKAHPILISRPVPIRRGWFRRRSRLGANRVGKRAIKATIARCCPPGGWIISCIMFPVTANNVASAVREAVARPSRLFRSSDHFRPGRRRLPRQRQVAATPNILEIYCESIKRNQCEYPLVRGGHDLPRLATSANPRVAGPARF